MISFKAGLRLAVLPGPLGTFERLPSLAQVVEKFETSQERVDQKLLLRSQHVYAPFRHKLRAGKACVKHCLCPVLAM